MQKQKKQLVIIFIALIVIIILFAGLKLYNKNYRKEEETVTHSVTDHDAASVQTVSFTNENGSFSFVKEGDAWYEEKDRSIGIDTFSIEELIQAAVSITSENKLENVEDLSQYGLDAPQITVAYTTPEMDVTIEIGNYNSTISLYYMRLKDENTVYTIDSTLRNSFTKDIEDLKIIEAESEE